MDSIRQQCEKLYLESFEDDIEFTNVLFENCFETNCYYLTEDERVVSMLFALDVFIGSNKGKYIYAVATNPEYRGKGYMRKLFCDVEDILGGEYSFLCLRPMNEGLFDFYARLGFKEKFFKKQIALKGEKVVCKPILVNNANDVRRIRKALCNEKFVEYGSEFYKLLTSYCEILTDSLENPTYLIIRERLSGKIKEFLGDTENLPVIFYGEASTCNGGERYAVYKSLGYNFSDKAYLGLAMD